MADETCRTCRYWRAYDGSQIGEEEFNTVPAVVNGKLLDVYEYGQCRRNPPVISDHMASIAIQRPRFGGNEPDPENVATATAVEQSCLWPVTYFTEWCGHHPDIEQQWRSPC